MGGSRVAVESTRKYAFIDAMRGLAFLAVLFYHQAPRVNGIGGLTLRFAYQWFEGVQLFFVVSALTMFLSMDSRRRERRPTLNFFIRRYFRIAPLFYVAGLLYNLLRFAQSGGPPPSAWGVAETALFVNAWSYRWINGIVPGGWTIAVEMSFYLLVPLLYRLIRTPLNAAWAAFASLIFAFVARLAARTLLLRIFGAGESEGIEYYLYVWLPMQMPTFCAGFCLYFLVRRVVGGESPAGSGRGLAWLLLLASSYLVAALTASDSKLFLGHVLYSVAFVMLGWSLAVNPNRLLVNPITCRLGVLSFSAYLAHFAAMDWVNLALARAGPGYDAWPPFARLAISLSLVLVVTLSISMVTYRLVEVPGQALGRRIIKSLEGIGAPTSPEPGRSTSQPEPATAPSAVSAI